MLIYKIFTTDQWHDMQANGSSAGAPIDLQDGYVHFSTAEQARETAAKHFAGQDSLVLVAAESDKMDALKWEVSRGDALFPHLFDRFNMHQVVWAEPLPLDDQGHVFPEQFE